MITEILTQRRDIILKKWGDSALAGYSQGMATSKRNKKDRFGNPVVYLITNGLEIIFDELTAPTHSARLNEALEDIVKIKSLQTEKPSGAVEFLFGLKKILEEELENSGASDDLSGDIEKLNSDIDNLILTAFDIFMKCRERIYEIRSNEILRRSYKLLERSGMMAPSLQIEGDDNEEIG